MSDHPLKLKCRKCSARYTVDQSLAGKRTKCTKCGAILFAPFTSADALLDWARTAPWERLAEYVRGGYASGYSQDVINKFVQIWTNRRWGEEDKCRTGLVESRVLRSEFSRLMDRWKPGTKSDPLLENAFENLIVSVFGSLGYQRTKAYKFGESYSCAEISSNDQRVGLVIFPASPNAPAFGITDVRAAALQLTKMPGCRGHIFSTTGFTPQARMEAKKHRKLKTYNSMDLAWLVDTADNYRNQTHGQPYAFQ